MRKKILVIRFSSIGDIVLTTPVLRCLKAQTGAEIHFLTKKTFSSLVEHNPNVDQVILLEKDIHVLIHRLRTEAYDLVVDLHHNLRTRRIKLALGVKATSFYKLNIEKWLLVRFKINRLPDKHIVDRYLDTITSFGVVNDGKGLDFFLPKEKQVDVNKTFGLQSGEYVALVIGAAHQTKCMTISQLVQLCQSVQVPVVLLGGKEETGKAASVMSEVRGDLIKNAVGKLDILQSASVVEQAAMVLTPDTGLMHVAAAFRKPLLVVWGNTVPEFGMYPYYGDEQVAWKSFEVKGLRCRPCSKIGYEKCPRGHFRCMADQDISEMGAAIHLMMLK